jgi:hypothetical protein
MFLRLALCCQDEPWSGRAGGQGADLPGVHPLPPQHRDLQRRRALAANSIALQVRTTNRGVRLFYADQYCVCEVCQYFLSTDPAGKDQGFNTYYKLEQKICYELI